MLRTTMATTSAYPSGPQQQILSLLCYPPLCPFRFVWWRKSLEISITTPLNVCGYQINRRLEHLTFLSAIHAIIAAFKLSNLLLCTHTRAIDGVRTKSPLLRGHARSEPLNLDWAQLQSRPDLELELRWNRTGLWLCQRPQTNSQPEPR